MFYLIASRYGISELDFQAKHGINVLGREFIIDEWLPNDIKLAKFKCRKYLEANIFCILVQFSDRFGLYLDLDNNRDCERIIAYIDRDKIIIEPTKVETILNSSKLDTFEDLSELVEKLARDLNIHSEIKFRRLLSQKLILDREIALQILKEYFTNYVGPFARIIYEDLIEQMGDKLETFEDFSEFFNRLANEVEELEVRQQFQYFISKNIVCDRNFALKIIRCSLQKSLGPISDLIDENALAE